ncbi:protein of unknown function [Streptomyces murinus]
MIVVLAGHGGNPTFLMASVALRAVVARSLRRS